MEERIILKIMLWSGGIPQHHNSLQYSCTVVLSFQSICCPVNVAFDL